MCGIAGISRRDGATPEKATMAALAGDSIYDALIQGVSQMTLFPDPFSLDAAAQDSNSADEVWGPDASDPLALDNTFSINHKFSLTGLDQATINSSFFIIPEPATGLLLFTAGLLLVRRRK